jgi:cytochrome c-type biogenesis protein
MPELAGIGVLAALAAGTVSFLSPCVLPLVPGYLSFIAGRALDPAGDVSARSRLHTLGLSAFFVLGFSTVFIAFGASATALSRLLLAYRYEATIAGGLVVILFGLFMMGLLRLPWLERDLRFHGALRGGHPLGAYVIGVAFAFGWTPCIGPVLGAILTASAVSATVVDGVTLLGLYSLGLGLPFLLAALFTEGLVRRLRGMRRAGRLFEFGAGAVMVVMGIAMITGELSALSYWLLETFPALATIG